MVIRALPHEHLQRGILGRESLEEITDLLLAHSVRQVVVSLVDEIRRYIRIEVVKTVDPYPLKHLANIILSMWEV